MYRYIGVAIGEHLYNLDIQPGGKDKVAYEWRLEDTDGVKCEVVHPQWQHALRRGVPVPASARQAKIATVADMEQLAQRSKHLAHEVISRRVGCNDLELICQHLGVSTADGVNRQGPCTMRVKWFFKWSLHTPEWEWHKDMSLLDGMNFSKGAHRHLSGQVIHVKSEDICIAYA